MSGLMGKPREPKPQPPPPRMVDRGSPEIVDASRRKIASEIGRTGRSSTILSTRSGEGGSGGRQTLG